MPQIELKNVTKYYGKTEIFKNVNLIFDSKYYNFLIGENGSGKSTLIKCIIDEIKYSGVINKKDYSISYSPEKIILPDYVTVYNFLSLLVMNKKAIYSSLSKIIEEYLIKFNIEKYKNKIIHELSKGTKQKIILIQTLLSDSDIYIFDEPLSGLDEDSKKSFLDELRKLKKLSKIIIISTHHYKQYNFKYKKIYTFPLKEDILNEFNQIA